MKYEVLLSPNSNQWWVYDNERDVYIDPPADILKSLKEYSEQMAEQEKLFTKIVNESPAWLFDNDYTYADIEI